jgi:hypothetical protein
MYENNIKALAKSQPSRFESALRETVAKTLDVDVNDRMLGHFLAACEYGSLDPEKIAESVFYGEYHEQAAVRNLVETGLEAKGVKVTETGLYRGDSVICFEFNGGEYHVTITTVA